MTPKLQYGNQAFILKRHLICKTVTIGAYSEEKFEINYNDPDHKCTFYMTLQRYLCTEFLQPNATRNAYTSRSKQTKSWKAQGKINRNTPKPDQRNAAVASTYFPN